MSESRAPGRYYEPIPLGGVWDESGTPSRVGGSGLTACQNMIYRRYGAWGKRAGSTMVYAAVQPPAPNVPPAPPPPYSPAPPTPPKPPAPPPGSGSGGPLHPPKA